MVDDDSIIVRYAESEPDMVAIHQFLLIVPQSPAVRCPLNAVKILHEVIRVVKDEVALMLIHNGAMVGTMGIINPTWWYGDGAFLTDRWHFTLPSYDSTSASAMMLDEAVKVADAAGLEFIHQGRVRKGKKGVFRMMPRSFGAESDMIEGQGV